ncbi:MAG: lipopolysaccharide biosynthesis glycosyltransferase, partial [Rhodothermales bacterium]
AATFNAGFFCVRPSKGGRLFDRAVSLLEPARMARVTSGHTDQVILNEVFQGQVEFLPSTFNTLVQHELDAAFLTSRIVLHYAGRPKPWSLRRYLRYSRSDGPWRGAFAQSCGTSLPLGKLIARKILLRMGSSSVGRSTGAGLIS